MPFNLFFTNPWFKALSFLNEVTMLTNRPITQLTSQSNTHADKGLK